ncbi:MAG: DUF2800 domain-containing protein, partial [Steroidobacteraceae bacterium]
GLPVVIERIHPDMWGEPDGWRHDAIEEVLHVPDYKYGFDVVEVYENWQVIAYAIGLLDSLGLNDQVTKVRMIVVQPRAFHTRGPVREWVVMGDELRAYANIAHSATLSAVRKPGEIVFGGKLEAVAGPHCLNLHCPARHVCNTSSLAAGHIAEWTREAEPAFELSPAQMGTEWSILRAARDTLDARLTGIAAAIEQHIRSGTRVPGAKMEAGGAPLKWKPDTTIDDVHGLGAMLNPPKDMRNLPLEPNSRKCPVITPTQAIKAGVDKALVEVYAEPTPTAMKLTPDDGTEARRAFGGTK